MSRRVIALLAAILTTSDARADVVTQPPAFWEGKPKIEAKLRDERAVIVSVRTEKGVLDKDADLFTINGVGWVKRDPASIYTMAQQYERMKEISEMFREVKYEPATNRVFVICQALGYQARMLLAVTPSEKTETAPRQIAFKVIDGHFLGLAGVMAFRELPPEKLGSGSQNAPQTEVSFRANLEAREIPIPRILVGFALEVLVQKVAMRMRTHFEEAPVEWAGHPSQPADVIEAPKVVAPEKETATPKASPKAKPKKSAPSKSKKN